MNNVTDRIAYLKGLAEGMNLDKDKNTHKLIIEIISVLDEMASALIGLTASQDELNEYVESIDDDLADLEDVLFGDEDDLDDDDYDDEDDEDEDDDDGGFEDDDETISYSCPHCGHELSFNVSDIDFNEDTLCPECRKPIFPEVEEPDPSPDDDSDA